tara:strand:- start:353 stop:685 length:333 start_codon:yes stop_codon:yes gene_type:complete
MIKYFSIFGVLALFSTLPPSPTPPISTDDTAAKSYILGFEEGSEAINNAVNAQMCAEHYKKMGQGPGAECHQFFENFKLRLARYEKVKMDLEKRQNKNGKSSGTNKKNSN